MCCFGGAAPRASLNTDAGAERLQGIEDDGGIVFAPRGCKMGVEATEDMAEGAADEVREVCLLLASDSPCVRVRVRRGKGLTQPSN